MSVKSSEEKKKIFLTGINGFLGSHVAIKLKEQGHQVVGLVRSDVRTGILKDYSIQYCEGDLLEPESYNAALKTCDVVIHTAAVATFGIKNTSDFYKVNYNGTKLLLEYSKKNGIKRFIHTSTRGTLGVAENPEQSNESLGNKDISEIDDYMKSKYMAEKEVIKYSKDCGMECIVLSPTALIGSYDHKPTPVGNIVLSFLRGKTRVYMDGGINLIDVEDAAHAFVSALDKGETGQIYILGNENITLYELFRRLSTISNVPLPKIKMPFSLAYIAAFLIEKLSKLKGSPPFATPGKVISLYNNHSYCNPAKAVQVLGLPQTPIMHTLEKVVNWYKENSYYQASE